MPEGLEILKELKSCGKSVAYVGDVVGTGSSRKSGINSIQWHLGDEIEGVPKQKNWRYCDRYDHSPDIF